MSDLKGSKVSSIMQETLKKNVEELKNEGIEPGLAVILVGDDPASQVYVGHKEKAAEKLGIRSEKITYPAETSQEEILAKIDELNNDDSIDGILIQLPLPKHIDEAAVIRAIDPAKDVDCFHPENIGKLFLGTNGLLPCTPNGIMHLLKAYDIDVAGKNVVIIGRSNIVGKPLAHLFLKEDATVTITHSKTKHLNYYTRNADILVAAIGKANFVTSYMVKKGAVVIDVGINRVGKKLYGDAHYESVSKLASYITPVPGGIGPMTITMLMYNTIKASRMRRKHED